MTNNAASSIKSVETEAMVIRADGSTMNLGVIASWHRNPLVRLWRWIRRKQ